MTSIDHSLDQFELDLPDLPDLPAVGIWYFAMRLDARCLFELQIVSQLSVVSIVAPVEPITGSTSITPR